jgi:general nucleoside transport system permease protein
VSAPYSLRLERRPSAPKWARLVVPIGAIVFGILCGALILLIGRHNPIEVFSTILAPIRSISGLTALTTKATPLILTGLAVALALRMNIWNIGAEGQLVMGAIAACGVGLYAKGLPGTALLVLMLAASVIAGAVWALIAAVPKATFGLNEIITTLFLNYVGLLLAGYLVVNKWADPAALGFAYTKPVPMDARLPKLWGHVPAGIFLALLAALLVWYLVTRTRWGFAVRVAGGNARAAQYLGLGTAMRTIVVMALSGALAGLAGGIELTGVTSRLQLGISGGYGYSGILIAFLAKQRPVLVVVMAYLFAALTLGAISLQSMGVPSAMATVIQALIVVFLLVGEAFLSYRIRFAKSSFASVADTERQTVVEGGEAE